MKVGSFLVLGNDKKMNSCANRLNLLGYDADLLNNRNLNDCIKLYENIILPLPTVSNGKINGTSVTFEDFIEITDVKNKVFCGNLDVSAYKNCISYYFNESFLIRNSRLTSQGVLKLIIENTEKDLSQLSVAVIGFGRCGKAICRLLMKCDMNVTSFSRRCETREEALDFGINADDITNLNEKLNLFDVIVNTVPVNIISRRCIVSLKPSNLYIEVASKPYGFDISGTDLFNFGFVLGESLPGRFFPLSAGTNIADTVLNILKEEEYG